MSPRKRRILLAFAGLGLGISLLALLGPRAKMGSPPELPPPPTSLSGLPQWVQDQDTSEDTVLPGNHSQLHWGAEPGRRTPLALVYLHGFSAGPMEIEPVMTQAAAELGANLYMPLLAGHGRGSDAMGRARAEQWVAETRRAIQVGQLLGERVVVVGTSTGGTLAVIEAPPTELAGLVLINPNFGPQNRATELGLLPWGELLLTRLLAPYSWEPSSPAQAQHWTTTYEIQAVVEMMLIVQAAREVDPATLELPTLVLRSDADHVVDQAAVTSFAGGLPQGDVVVVPYTSGENGHVLAGAILSPSRTQEVQGALVEFCRGI